MPQTALESKQRALLHHLVALTAQQASALDRGGVVLLTHLSDLRGRAIRDAAPYVPPQVAWEPELASLVAQAQARADDLQRSIHTCMAAVRRDLAALTHHQHATHYLSGALPAGERGGTWQA